MADNPSFDNLDDLIEYKLLDARRLFFSTTVTSATAADTIRKLWYMEMQKPGEPITLVINSPGGAIDAGFAIWDQVKAISSPVSTLITGLAASMGSVLSLCADKGRRYATPNARIMLHQPLIHGVIEGAASDLDIQAKEILKTRDRMVELYANATGQSADTIRKILDRDTWMSPPEAKDFGLLDHVVSSLGDVR